MMGVDGDLAHGAAFYVPPSGRSAAALGATASGALAGAHAIGAHREPPLVRQRGEAQLAEHAARLEPVEALAREGRPPALAAGLGAGTGGADADSDQERGHVGHGALFHARRVSPLDSRFLGPRWHTTPTFVRLFVEDPANSEDHFSGLGGRVTIASALAKEM